MLGFVVILLLFFIISFYLILKKKNLDIWIMPYVRSKLSKKDEIKGPKHIMFCYVDHYEPQWQSPEIEVERSRVDRWMNDYPELCKNHKDADGKFPQHTFFYPEEEYREEHLAKITDLCKKGYGEIEVHLHHDDDTSENLRETLTGFAKKLNANHGVLSRFPDTGELAYAFIHGNWSLDNSRADGRWCGVNDELIVLKETGCYADFTLPSAPSETQTKKINSIYYAEDNPQKPKSHNTGRDVEVNGKSSGDLMIIQGPLGLNWKQRKFGLMPKIEAADVRAAVPPSKDRIDLWVDSNIHVKGRPEWTFVKIHTHGTQEGDMDTLLGKETDEMFSYLESRYNDGTDYILHYVTAREMYNIVKAAEAGLNGDPNEYRDYLLPAVTYSVK
jgi:hypothetical protein